MADSLGFRMLSLRLLPLAARPYLLPATHRAETPDWHAVELRFGVSRLVAFLHCGWSVCVYGHGGLLDAGTG